MRQLGERAQRAPHFVDVVVVRRLDQVKRRHRERVAVGDAARVEAFGERAANVPRAARRRAAAAAQRSAAASGALLRSAQRALQVAARRLLPLLPPLPLLAQLHLPEFELERVF